MSTLPTLLPDLLVDGKLVKPNRGTYRCPHHCYKGSYAAPKWKTQAGFERHMASCPGSPSALSKKAAADELLAVERAEKRDAAVAALGLHIGDEIFYVRYQVIQPTHVQRGGRQIRVRYEEVRRYVGARATIESFEYGHALTFNGGISPVDRRSSLAQAQEDARAMQLKYEADCDFAAMCR